MCWSIAFDGSKIRLYLNGELDASASAPGLLIATNDLPLSIGAEDDGDRSYDGAVDEVRMFNYALDASAVFEQMQGGLSPDRDWDGFIDANDAFPDDPNEWFDTDRDGVGDNSDLDDDGDGMPDGWELANGFDPRLAADADLDADADGISNLDEFLWNTNPHGALDPYLVGSWNFDTESGVDQLAPGQPEHHLVVARLLDVAGERNHPGARRGLRSDR